MGKNPLIEKVILGKIKFYKKNKRRKTIVSPAQIFDEGYAGLDNLIHKNLYRRIKDSEREELMNEWWENRPKGFSAVIPLETGEKLNLDIEYRTNTDSGTIKHPNIVYLQQDGKTLFILRRPMFYDSISRHIEKVKNKFPFRISGSLYNKNDIKENCPALIPEPLLIPVLESFYEEGYPRVTAPYREIEKSGESFYLRQWMNEPFADSPIDESIVAKHISFLHSMGLISMFDRRPSHYFIIKQEDETSIVNIDPDFVVWTPRLYGNEESRCDDDEFSEDEEKENFSKEDEGKGKIELEDKEAELYREQFRLDEIDFLDNLFKLHPSSSINPFADGKYYNTKLELKEYSQELSQDFIERINEYLRF
jgi:hypothetical protein